MEKLEIHEIRILGGNKLQGWCFKLVMQEQDQRHRKGVLLAAFATTTQPKTISELLELFYLCNFYFKFDSRVRERERVCVSCLYFGLFC